MKSRIFAGAKCLGIGSALRHDDCNNGDMRQELGGCGCQNTWRNTGLQGIGNMLRITVTEGASEQRWVLQGRLTGGSVEELTANWRIKRRHCPPAQSCIVDLNEITSIDKDGEQVLRMMIRDGAKFVATGLYTKHLLESLSADVESRSNSK
jgi:hypothetical protein